MKRVKLRSNTRRNRNKALSLVVQAMKVAATHAPNGNEARTALAMLAASSKGLRENVGNLKQVLEARIRQGNNAALENMRQIVTPQNFRRYQRIWANARRNQRRNQFIRSFGTVNTVTNHPGNNRMKFITTSTGQWMLVKSDGGYMSGILHKLVNYGAGMQIYRPYGQRMGPINLRNGRLVLANRPANWNLSNPNPYDLFHI